MPATPAGAQRLEALETHALAARCLAGIGQLSELILGPRARHEELLLAALLARARPEAVEALQAELLATRRELAERCAALAAHERAQSESAERERALERELERLQLAQAAIEQRAEELSGERDALELGRSALEQIERELAALRAERDWRSAEMQAAAAELEGLRFALFAAGLQARARRWKAGAP
jgi:chromosome segregation ATPase